MISLTRFLIIKENSKNNLLPMEFYSFHLFRTNLHMKIQNAFPMDKDSIFYWIQWTVLCKISNFADTTKKKWLVKSINANTKQAVAAKKPLISYLNYTRGRARHHHYHTKLRRLFRISNEISPNITAHRLNRKKLSSSSILKWSFQLSDQWLQF